MVPQALHSKLWATGGKCTEKDESKLKTSTWFVFFRKHSLEENFGEMCSCAKDDCNKVWQSYFLLYSWKYAIYVGEMNIIKTLQYQKNAPGPAKIEWDWILPGKSCEIP